MKWLLLIPVTMLTLATVPMLAQNSETPEAPSAPEAAKSTPDARIDKAIDELEGVDDPKVQRIVQKLRKAIEDKREADARRTESRPEAPRVEDDNTPPTPDLPPEMAELERVMKEMQERMRKRMEKEWGGDPDDIFERLRKQIEEQGKGDDQDGEWVEEEITGPNGEKIKIRTWRKTSKSGGDDAKPESKPAPDKPKKSEKERTEDY